jgi:uncharacterized protein HemX
VHILEELMTTNKSEADHAPDSSLDFGSIHLDGGGDSLSLDLEQVEEKHEEEPARAPAPVSKEKTPSIKPAPAPESQPSAARPQHKGANPRYSPVAAPRRSYKKELTIAAICLVVAGLIGGAIYGFIQWRQAAQSEHEAQMKALDQSSLDSLKSQALKKEKFGS